MAAKPCPSCGLKNPESASACDCGYQFAQTSASPGRVVCPRCGSTVPSNAPGCSCGHSLTEDNEELRHMQVHRLTLGWFGIGGGLFLIASAFGLVMLQYYIRFGGILVPLILVTLGVGLLIKGARSVSSARAGLQALGARPKPPPQARVLKK